MWTNVYSSEQLGEFVKDVRRKKGLRQDEFAARLGVSHATLSNLEAGKSVSAHTYERALQLLGYRLVVVPKTAEVRVTED